MSVKNIEMTFGVEDGKLYPVVHVGSKNLRLNDSVPSIEAAEVFVRAFVLGLTVENADGFLDIHDERERQNALLAEAREEVALEAALEQPRPKGAP